MKKFVFSAMIILLLLVPFHGQAAASGAFGAGAAHDWNKLAPKGDLLGSAVKADSAILFDSKTGKVLFEKDADAKRYPASTTKIMTCLVALEHCQNLSMQVTVGVLPHADFINGSDNIGLKKGEQLTMEQLLYAMMVKSGNDAADAVAQTVGGGSIEAFVEMMNQKAQDLGMAGTHYTNPNGLKDDTDHYTTARDMAALASAAMQRPEFARMVSTVNFTIPPTNKTNKSREYTNTNYLLRNEEDGKFPGSYYSYATGVKTGSTDMAGNSLVSSADHDGLSMIGVVLHDDDRKDIFADSITMLDFGFRFYATLDVLELVNNQPYSMAVKNAAADDPGSGKLSLLMKPRDAKAYLTDKVDVIAQIKSAPSGALQPQVEYSKDVAPIGRDETVGTVTFAYDGIVVLTCDLIASRAVAAQPAQPAKSASQLTPSPSSSAGKAEKPKTSGINLVLLFVAAFFLLMLLAFLAVRLVGRRQSKSADLKHTR